MFSAVSAVQFLNVPSPMLFNPTAPPTSTATRCSFVELPSIDTKGFVAVPLMESRTPKTFIVTEVGAENE